VPPVSFAVQAQLTDREAFTKLAGAAEVAGFDAFVVADHPGVSASPFVALAAAAASTSTINVGTYVLNSGVRDPVQIAADVATLDVVSSGRAQLGLGAGHTPAEWTMSGKHYPSPGDRVARCIEVAEVACMLLAGETVQHAGAFIESIDATLTTPRPVQRHVPLLIGGGNRQLLRFGGAHADLVGISGLGRTLPDGHRHEARWSDDAVADVIATIRDAASSRAEPPVIDALVQHVELTDDREAAARRVAGAVPGLDPAHVLSSPFVLVGTEPELVDELYRHHARWGISRFTVRAEAFDVVAKLVSRLAR
jgi:probable F420-dependent oxidoreductase